MADLRSRGRHLDEVVEILGSNRVEDLSWLCSLSESELDTLISLKMLVLQRAKLIGHDKLAMKFDLKMLRALGFILMEYLKGRMKDLSITPSSTASDILLDGCGLLKCNLDDIMSIEDIQTCIGTNARKNTAKRKWEDVPLNGKRWRSETNK